jgi:WD40 repeat protein
MQVASTEENTRTHTVIGDDKNFYEVGILASAIWICSNIDSRHGTLFYTFLQALGAGSNVCEHPGEAVTAICCFPGKDEHTDILVTATTNTEAIHSLHIWHIQRQQAEYARDGSQIASEACIPLKRPNYPVTTQHANAIVFISGVPVSARKTSRAAFVTCSKNLGDDAHGAIRLWALNGDEIAMKIGSGVSVNELQCKASISKAIVTVNKEGHILIAACYATAHTGVDLWNTTTGTGMSITLYFIYCFWLVLITCLLLISFCAETMHCCNEHTVTECSPVYRRPATDELDYVTNIAFSPDGSKLFSSYQRFSYYHEYRGRIYPRMYAGGVFRKELSQGGGHETTVWLELEGRSTHMVFSADGQYLANHTSEHEIEIWREQYDGSFGRYVQLAGYKQKTHGTLQFTAQAVQDGEERVLLLALYYDGQDYYLHTYDILTQQEIREPAVVIHPHISASDLLVDLSYSMNCVVSATHGASTVHVVNPLKYVSATTRRFKKLKDAPVHRQYADAVELFKEHPAVAFQPFEQFWHEVNSKHVVFTLIEYALTASDFGGLLRLLDPDIPILNGKQFHNYRIFMLCYVRTDVCLLCYQVTLMYTCYICLHRC